MEDCQDIQRRISFFVEGEIPEVERKEVAIHLRGCLICQAEAEQHKKLNRRLNALTEVRPPANMVPDIMSSIMKNEAGIKNRLIGAFQVLAVFMGIFSLPFITILLSKMIMASHQAFNITLNDKGFFVKLIMLIVKTLSSLLNDTPLFFDMRIPVPTLQLLPALILGIGILLTAALILGSLLFSFTLPKYHLPVKSKR